MQRSKVSWFYCADLMREVCADQQPDLWPISGALQADFHAPHELFLIFKATAASLAGGYLNELL